MKIRFDNVNFNANNGPNGFGVKLAKEFYRQGHKLVSTNPDVQLSFIQKTNDFNPCVLRLDGIYFNTDQDWKAQNEQIRLSYLSSQSVVVQSNFNKELVFEYFGERDNIHVIANGTNLEEINVPTNLLNEDLENYYNAEKEIIMSGVPISSPTLWQLLFQLYGYLMPFVLYAAWAALAIKDIDSNDKVNGSMKYVWLGVVYLVPFFGVLVYHLAGPSAISRSMKLAAIVGGLFSYIVILVAGAVISGLV